MSARCHSRILLRELTSSLVVDFDELSLVVDDKEGWRRGTVEVVQLFECNRSGGQLGRYERRLFSLELREQEVEEVAPLDA